MTLSRRHALLFAIFIALCTPSCGLFSQDDLDVTYTEDFSFALPAIDSASLCSANQDCDQGVVASDRERPLDPIDLDVEIDIIEKTGRSELADFAGNFRSVTITRIDYALEENTLTFDLPAIDLYLAPLGVSSASNSQAVKMATIPETAAMRTVTEGRAEIDQANAPALSALIQSLKVSAIALAQPVVKVGQPFPPSGRAKLSVTVYVTFVANPTDSIKR